VLAYVAERIRANALDPTVAASVLDAVALSQALLKQLDAAETNPNATRTTIPPLTRNTRNPPELWGVQPGT
jgi:hypothetical protein